MTNVNGVLRCMRMPSGTHGPPALAGVTEQMQNRLRTCYLEPHKPFVFDVWGLSNMAQDELSRSDAAVALGHELRRLRQARGLSQRALTKMLGLSAHSNIADYEHGRRIPPRDIVNDCDRLLNAGGELSAQLDRALAQRAQPVAQAPPVPVGGMRRLASVAVLAVSVIVLLSWSQVRPDSPAVASSIWDGNDPKAAGCADDATSIDAQPIRAHATQLQLGTVHLRYSPHCQAAWAKFEPLPPPSPQQQVMVVVETIRPADGMKTVFHYPGLEQIYGDMLLTGPGCVQATASVQVAGEIEATGSTACLTPTLAAK